MESQLNILLLGIVTYDEHPTRKLRKGPSYISCVRRLENAIGIMEPEQTPLITTSDVTDESSVSEVNTPSSSQVKCREQNESISSDHVSLVNVTSDSDQCPLEHPVGVSVSSLYWRRKGI
ncbi:hypothetical protein J6590_045721 [Homalodisca vitripennis]|nr:hypothetical protein J6590_045721 [Homalodisca vitripennis]